MADALFSGSSTEFFHHHNLAVVTPRGRHIITSSAPLMATFHRKNWISEQIAALKSRGVVLRLGCRFLSVQSTQALTNQGTMPFDFLIGSDGSASRVRASLGLARETFMATRQILLDAKHPATQALPSIPTVWFQPNLFKSGYAWCFQSGQEYRLGAGFVTSSTTPKNLKQCFYSWLNRLGISPDIFPGAGTAQSATINCDFAGYRFGSVFLTGDAAGLPSPLTGEGIAAAIVSGREVAMEILHPSYRSISIPLLARKHRRTLATLSLLNGKVGHHLYTYSHAFLRLPVIQKEVLKRYVF